MGIADILAGLTDAAYRTRTVAPQAIDKDGGWHEMPVT
jgi:hypothetical protein